MNWERQVVDGVRMRVSLPRAERLCKLCEAGIGDESHVIAECVEYSAVRHRHAHLFECLGGWEHVTDVAVSVMDMRQFMSQDQHLPS